VCNLRLTRINDHYRVRDHAALELKEKSVLLIRSRVFSTGTTEVEVMSSSVGRVM
jgi:hypothetical protein